MSRRGCLTPILHLFFEEELEQNPIHRLSAWTTARRLDVWWWRGVRHERLSILEILCESRVFDTLAGHPTWGTLHTTFLQEVFLGYHSRRIRDLLLRHHNCRWKTWRWCRQPEQSLRSWHAWHHLVLMTFSRRKCILTLRQTCLTRRFNQRDNRVAGTDAEKSSSCCCFVRAKRTLPRYPRDTRDEWCFFKWSHTAEVVVGRLSYPEISRS